MSGRQTCSRNGLAYYPKLVCAVPFAPVTGPQAEAMAEAFKAGASYYAVTEYRAIVDCSGKQPQFKKEVVKRNH